MSATVAVEAAPVRERPILFSGPMVRAILKGRKTQTRRVITGAVTCSETGRPYWPGMKHGGDFVYGHHCPYGAPGDRMWVRETWGLHAYGDYTYWNRDSLSGRTEDDLRGSWGVAYAADAESPYDHWRPSIHMPRWASRLTLKVTSVRVERLQGISEDDARAEGVEQTTSVGPCRAMGWRGGADLPARMRATAAFHDLWDSINGKRGYGWSSNPWVWVVSFRRLP